MRTIRDCPVCVVGGAGFLGSHLVDYLVEERGCDVLVVDNLASGKREFVHPRARFEHADISGSEGHLLRLFREHGSRFVFNYAAWPYVPTSYARPLAVFEVNAFGALRVINAAQEAGCEATLQVSSAELYGEAGTSRLAEMRGDINDPESCEPTGRYRESHHKIDERGKVAPHSSYGAAKAAIDALVQVRFREAGTPVIALRQFNCVGEKETHPYVVPEIISQLQRTADAGKCHDRDYLIPTIRLGNNSFRDFLYAGDQVRIATELLERGNFGEVYNLGSESGIKVYDLAKLIGKVMGFADVRVEEDEARKRPWEIWHLQSDNTKLWSLFPNGMSAQTRDQLQGLTPLEEALRRTVAWFEGNGRRWPWQR
jgi:nucleoside-diphosphate-sugar epimerase